MITVEIHIPQIAHHIKKWPSSKELKKGGERKYTPVKKILTIVAVAVVKNRSQQHKR